ncbi:MAG: response regulator [Gammaproteobacteria bacterium]|nr:response regulator [Gammaproteobacteria bacterium]
MLDGTKSTQAKLLIVDDKAANLDLLREMLTPLDHQIFFATSGEKALEIASSVQPDLVLLDVMMPEMDGFETCRRFKQQEALREIPIIFVTARTDVEDLARGFNAGAVDYITKPVKQLEVHARVVTHLRIQSLIAEQREHLAALEQARGELESLNDTKDKFLSNLGREVSTSLAQLADTSASIRESAKTPCTSENGIDQHLADVNSSAQHVLHLLGAILEWPRLQTGQKLDLLSTQISDQELGNLLSSLNDLRFLSLAETRVGDAGLIHLKSLTKLQELHLDHTDITDEGLELLATLPHLEILDLKGTRITDDGLITIGRLTQLKSLYLTRTGITDAGLEHLLSLNNLETLILWDTAVGDTGLEHLKSLTQLKEIILWNTHITQEGAQALQDYLPECDVSTSMF